MFKGMEGSGDPREEEGVAAMTRCPREEEGHPIPVGAVRPNERRRLQGGGEEPPRDQTPREEERVPNTGGPRWPE
jgi:hypothetical protein